MFVHCVYFWLREDISNEGEQRFLEGLQSLTTIDTVANSYVGTPADTDRPVIERSYSYALVAVFDDKQAHDAYQEHPVHDDFRDDCAEYWTNVRIYDFETNR